MGSDGSERIPDGAVREDGPAMADVEDLSAWAAERWAMAVPRRVAVAVADEPPPDDAA